MAKKATKSKKKATEMPVKKASAGKGSKKGC